MLPTVVGCQLAATGQNLQGRRLHEQGQHMAALQRFQQAVTDDPTNADAYYNMGRTYQTLGSNPAVAQDQRQAYLEKAESMFAQCLVHSPDHVDCHRGLAVLLRDTGHSERAYNLLKNWAVANPQSRIGSEAQVELARLYFEDGDVETAKLSLNQAMQDDLNNPRVFSSMAFLQEGSGQYDEARNNYARSFRLNSMQPKVAQRISALQRSAGARFDASRSGVTRTVNSNNNPPLRY